MNHAQTKDAIAVMQAAIDGKTIEFKQRRKNEWIGPLTFNLIQNDISWDWDTNEYRVKPEPMEIEVWVDGKTGVFLSVLGDLDHQAFMERSGYTKKKFREVL